MDKKTEILTIIIHFIIVIYLGYKTVTSDTEIRVLKYGFCWIINYISWKFYKIK